MATAITDSLYTADDLLKLDEPHRFELIDGQLVERGIGAESSGIALELMVRVREFLRVNPLGLVFGADCGYRLFPDRPNLVRFPDGSFVRRGRLPDEKRPSGHVPFAPDLALEVVSPNDEACDLMEKIEEYIGAGVPLIWVVYPRTKRVLVFRTSGQVTRLTETDTLQGEDVLPGFSCPVADLFVGL